MCLTPLFKRAMIYLVVFVLLFKHLALPEFQAKENPAEAGQSLTDRLEGVSIVVTRMFVPSIPIT